MGIWDSIRSGGKTARAQAEWAPYGGQPLEQYRDAMTRDRSAYGGQTQQADQSRNRFLDMIGGGQQAANTAAQGMFQSVLPQFQQGLQSLGESQIARGVTGGETEGRGTQAFVSDFSRNLATAMAGQATSLYGQQLGAMGGLAESDRGLAETTQNRYLDLLSGRLEYDQAKKARKAQNRAGILGGLGQIGGTMIGAYGALK